MIDAQTSVDALYLVGPQQRDKMKKLGIATIEDLLRHYPSRYLDYSMHVKIAKVPIGSIVTVSGQLSEFKNVYTKSGRTLQKAVLSDETGSLDLMWFNQPFLKNSLKNGQNVSVSGKVELQARSLGMISPDYEVQRFDKFNILLPTIHTGRLVPVYPETQGVSSKWLRSRISTVLNLLHVQITEFLPPEIMSRHGLIDINAAIRNIHFPMTFPDTEIARQRLSFDELFLTQLASLRQRNIWRNDVVGNKFEIQRYAKDLQNFLDSLPFTLTAAQSRSVREILSDLDSLVPMNRLLQGEVGSGKTVVSTIAMYVAHLNHFNSLLMAPTEILAKQHYETVKRLLKPFKIKIGIFTSKEKSKHFDIAIGTHALLSDKIKVKNLGLVVIDEQQRFGVEQRAILKEKGSNPHLLTMTATPIPRTMALTLYGELDLSTIDELPKERKHVKTWVVPPMKRHAGYSWIELEIKSREIQAFVICPFVEESESMTTIKAATKEYDELRKNVFPDLRLGLLHGKMKEKDKAKVLSEFKEKKLDILVATPIVEVGIDFPNANIIIIEGADRFGLTQLHQLRGRVGRGEKQAYCLIYSSTEEEKSIQRLKALETNFVGARLAEIDLMQRGPGQIFGTKQHGREKELKIARLSDSATIQKTRSEAEQLLASSPDLKNYSPLRKLLEKYTIKKVSKD